MPSIAVTNTNNFVRDNIVTSTCAFRSVHAAPFDAVEPTEVLDGVTQLHSMLISPPIFCHTRYTRHIHRRRRPIVGLLQGVKTRTVLQKTVFVSQVIQPRTAPVTIFTIEINRANGPRSRLPRCQSACNLESRIIQKCLQRFDINTGGKTIESYTIHSSCRPDCD